MDRQKDDLCRAGLRLEYFTVAYNILEGVVSVLAGAAAGSIALVGFGLDSFIECFSGLILIWRLRRHSDDGEREAWLESKAVRLVALSFFLLAAYVGSESLRKLYLHEMPDGSIAGIFIALLSIIIMQSLARKKLKLGRALGSRALIADAKETVACIYFSVALLSGLLLNYLWGWWWADPAASLVIVAFLFREGHELWKEERRKVTVLVQD